MKISKINNIGERELVNCSWNKEVRNSLFQPLLKELTEKTKLTMQSIRLKYFVSDSDLSIIDKARTQYSNMLHYAYNRCKEGLSQKDVESKLLTLNNIDLVKNSFDIRSCAMHAKQIFNAGNDKVIFGGRKSFIDLMNGKISKDDWKEKRKVYQSIGEANQKGCRRFKIGHDLKTIEFKPNRNLHITLTISGRYKQYQCLLGKLYKAQESKMMPITYSLSKDCITLTFDEKILKENLNSYFVRDRIFAIDLNPNYIGYSIVDWKSSSEFNVIKSGTISIKGINDIDFKLNKLCNTSSSDKRRIHIRNKRNHEIFEICKFLTKECKHYQCEYFSFEKLDIESSDKGKGNRYNKLCNNVWNRNKFVQNITKRCSILGIRTLEVIPNYSSFVGNFLYRDLQRPDMELASIEIGRRCYEFKHQYVTKDKEIRKNIIRPEISDFNDRYVKSLEEFNISERFDDLVKLYYFLKKSGSRYRLSPDSLNLEFSRCFSPKSLVMKNLHCLTKIS